MRGTGWYSQCMVNYCIDNLLINGSEIKCCMYSSLTIPKEYFNPFIHYICTNFGKYAKRTINTMIGMFKMNTKEKYESIAISDDRNVMFLHALKNKSTIIQSLSCADKNSFM